MLQTFLFQINAVILENKSVTFPQAAQMFSTNN